MSVIGVGVDIVAIKRIGKMIDKHGQRFLERIFTELERQNAPQAKSSVTYFAGRWAAKEAIYKALQTELEFGVGWQDIEVGRHHSGAPIVELAGKAADQAGKAGIAKIHLSISHENDHAIAYAMAVDAKG
jgi:holo-[acyl-carrier protein] synthase